MKNERFVAVCKGLDGKSHFSREIPEAVKKFQHQKVCDNNLKSQMGLGVGRLCQTQRWCNVLYTKEKIKRRLSVTPPSYGGIHSFLLGSTFFKATAESRKSRVSTYPLTSREKERID